MGEVKVADAFSRFCCFESWPKAAKQCRCGGPKPHPPHGTRQLAFQHSRSPGEPHRSASRRDPLAMPAGSLRRQETDRDRPEPVDPGSC